MSLKSYCSLIILLLPLGTFSQKKIYTSIQENKKKYAEKNFFFDTIIDKRADQTNIGYVYKSSLTYQHPADFKKGLSLAFQNFLQNTFSNAKSENKLLLMVDQFEIAHVVTGKRIDSGSVILNFSFYRLRNDSGFFLYQYSGRMSEASDNVAFSHPNRIKRAILLSTLKLDSALSIKNSRFSFKLASENDSIQRHHAGMIDKTKIEQDSLEKLSGKPARFFLLTGFHGNVTATNIITGLNIDVLFRLKKDQDCLLGISTNFFVSGFFSKDKIPEYVKYDVLSIDLGMRILRHLKGKVFLNFNTHAILGKEYFTIDLFYGAPPGYSNQPYYVTFEKNLYGVQIDLGFYRMPLQKHGLYIGSDVFMRSTSSYVIDSYLGIKLNLGFKF